MPVTLYLRVQPRAFFLLTETHALVFRQPTSAESRASRSVVIAEFIPVDQVDSNSLIKASTRRTVEGVLGVTSVPSDRSPVPEIFLLLVSASSTLSPLLPSSSLRPSRVLAVEFHSLSSAFWDPPELTQQASFHLDGFEDELEFAVQQDVTSHSTMSQAQQQGLENPCTGMKKYLESGGFFYAEGCQWDISSRMRESNWVQAEKGQPRSHPLDTFDQRFVWNANLLAPVLAYRSGLPEGTRQILDEQSLLIPVVQGFCGSLPISTGDWTSDGRPEIAALGLISRLSWKRAGARFRTRGIDDDGQVANFVETEVLLATDSVCLSYVQVRGSVPLFWQQPSQGIQTLQQKVELTRPQQATQPAFDKHLLDLLEHYHSVHAINLLGQKDAEAMLSAAYSHHLDILKATLEAMPDVEKSTLQAKHRGTVNLTPYDFHSVVRASGQDAVKFDMSSRLREVAESTEDFGWTAIDAATGQVIELQQGVFRINCLDCLDRTNYVQDVISSITLSRFLQNIESPLLTSPTLWSAHRELWADNGDRLSKIYAGTGALNTSATRTGKKTFAGLLSDATKSVGRAYINNFQDKGKQNAIDMLLGMMAGQRPVILFDPIGDSVHNALLARVNEYSRTRTVSIFAGTWNLNGQAPGDALDAWLFPPNIPEPDIYMIAFQELVKLTAQQILQTDPAKKRMWEGFIMDTFRTRKGSNSPYMLYRSEQLVGAALIIVVKSELTKAMRNVEASTKKTGLSGLSGNKGGVGIRFDLFDSSLCFMTCHLAAGHGNTAERNADYRTISSGLKFLRGKMIDDHDVTIWAADFNYRIDLENADVRAMAESDQLDRLYAADQLAASMYEDEVFVGYSEGPIKFRPTYKYDNGTDQYDTSEKARIPAWTDRILFKGSALRLQEYNRAELRTSDHRPVYASFDATIREVDQPAKDRITDEIVKSMRNNDGLLTLDAKYEKAFSGSHSLSLLGDMTISSSTVPRASSPALKTTPTIDRAPRLPPRPPSSSSKLDNVPKTAQRPPSGFSDLGLPSGPSSLETSSSDGMYAMIASKKSSGRRPPPVPSRAGNPPLLDMPETTSPTLTPASTGDFMIVKPGIPSATNNKIPSLPSRSTPLPTSDSLDLDSPPPDLTSPAIPDGVKASNTPSSSSLRQRQMSASSDSSDRRGPSALSFWRERDRAAENPPDINRKTSANSTKSGTLGEKKSPPAVPRKPSTIVTTPQASARVGSDAASPVTSKASSDQELTSPGGKKATPITPNKPAALRSVSGAA